MRSLTWKERIAAGTRRAMPVIKTVEKVAGLAVNLKTPSLLGGLALVSAGIRTLNDALSAASAPMSCNGNIPLLFPARHLVDALRAAGASIRIERASNGRGDITHALFRGAEIAIGVDGFALFLDNNPQLLEWMRQAIDSRLPPALAVTQRSAGVDGDIGFESTEINLSQLDSLQGAKIAAATAPLLGSGRAILLTGKPGVGKSTMADEIAAKLQLGRVVKLEARSIGGGRSDSAIAQCEIGPSRLESALALMSARVVVVDDVDKAPLGLDCFEALRRVAKLVIYTANNGEHDDVLDAAMTRPPRVDEVFTIEPEHAARRAPFSALTDDQWAQVSQWPIAYLNEVEQRLLHRPDDLRLDDLAQRLARRTRSAGGMLR